MLSERKYIGEWLELAEAVFVTSLFIIEGPSMSMPAMKRQASDSFSSSSQLVVKRQKSSENLKNASALTTVGSGKGQNGALIQSVG